MIKITMKNVSKAKPKRVNVKRLTKNEVVAFWEFRRRMEKHDEE
jgi:hypothetical protein